MKKITNIAKKIGKIYFCFYVIYCSIIALAQRARTIMTWEESDKTYSLNNYLLRLFTRSLETLQDYFEKLVLKK